MVITKANISGSLTDKKFCVSHVPCPLNGKRIFAALFVALFLLTGVVGAYSGGDGSADSPYNISNSADLITLSTDSGNWNKYFNVTADIDLPVAGSPPFPIGNSGTKFTGTFDGQGHTISNFVMSKSEVDYIGLFGYLESGEIKNLGIEAGGSEVYGQNYVGVLVGYNFIGSITNCSATGDAIAGIDYAGGLVGYNGGFITNSYATGSATAINHAGGFVGSNNWPGSITNCYATGDATAQYRWAGGLVGDNKVDGIITNCYATGSATAGDDYAGGLVGDNPGTITNCYRHSDSGNSYGTYISDLSKFRDYSFLTETPENNGLGWSGDIISTDADSSMIWRAFEYKCQYPLFQWQSVETGTLRVNSTAENAAISFNGVSTEENTNHTFSEQPVGVYNITVECAGYTFSQEYQEVTLAGGETKLLEFTSTQLYSGGEGTTVRPYEISNSDDLIYLSTHSGDWGQNFTVTADIDLAVGGSPTATIGSLGTKFTGTFDGQGHTIRNFSLSLTGDEYIGLFGYVGSGGEICNLNVETDANGVHGYRFVGVVVGANGGSLTNCSATGTATAGDIIAGGLVGENYGSLTDCYATGNITAADYAGGLVGSVSSVDVISSLTNCYATGSATAADYAGGLVGYEHLGSITNCYATGSATADTNYAGGLVGYEHLGSIMNCYATGSATAADSAGGLVGYEHFGSITNCSATGSATADTNYAGGLVGYEYFGSITNCYATGSATADTNAGGLVGYEYFGSITNCYATGNVTATYYYAGGLVGNTEGDSDITNCYATGDATAGDFHAGGLVGINRGFISNCYATGTATVGYYAGGLVGENNGGTITNCYATGTATAYDCAGGLVGLNGGPLTNCYRYTGGVSDAGTLIADITKFKDYDFLIGTEDKNGLNWDSEIISTDADSSKTWRTFTNKVQYPIFQWQSFENGTLEVHSIPEDATISFNGVFTGVSTNYTFSGQPVGVYNVTVLKDGYDSATKSVTLTKDKTEVISFTLEQHVGTLQINSTPSGAHVYLNGTAMGPLTNYTFSGQPVGDYNVTVLKDGYDSATEIVTLIKDETKDISLTLVQQLGTIQVSSSPADATIWFDGENTGQFTNTALTNIPTGTHTIRVVKSGYYPATRSITVAKDEVTAVSFTLTYRSDGSDGDDPTPFVKSTPTPTPTPVPTTAIPTPAAVNPNAFTGTARLPVGPDGAVERTVTIRADDMSGYLTIDAGVVAQDASGMLQENISIVAVPATAIPSSGTIGLFAHSQALYAYTCTPEGVSFTPAITLTFTLSEEEWDLYGNQAEVAWFNSESGEWEVIAGVADADARTITIQISHFSTYALFADVAPEVPLPDMTGIPAGSSDGSSLLLWGGLIVALVVVGGILISRRQDK